MESPESYEKKFHWLEAARAYERALDSKQDDSVRADLLEQSRNCLFHAAMQARSNSIFQRRIRDAIAKSKTASILAGQGRARALRCLAWQDFLQFWLTKNATLKKKSLQRTYKLAEKALALAKSTDDAVNYVRTFDDLCFVYALGFDYETTTAQRAQKLQTGIDHCRRVIGLVREKDDQQILSRNLTRLALFIDQQGDEAFEQENREKLDREGIECWRKAVRIDRESALLTVGYPPAGFFRLLDEEEGAEVCKDALKLATGARDNFAIGWQLDQMAGRGYFEATWGLDPKQQFRIAQRAIRLSEKAEMKHQLTNFTTPNNGAVWSGSPQAEYFLAFSFFVTGAAQKRLYLEKAWRETGQLRSLAKTSGFPRVMMYAHHVMSCILQDRADVETVADLKKRFLRGALDHRLAFARINDKIHPSDFWSKATALRYTSRIRSRLAELEPRREKRLSLLKTAARDKELSAKFAVSYAKNISRGQGNTIHDQVGNIHLELAIILDSLFETTEDESFLRESAKAAVNGAEWYSDSADYRTLGLAYWRAAHAFDRLQAFTLAAENYENASRAYSTLSKKPPAILADLNREYASYLMAWNQIELARIAHRRLDFDIARKLYDRAATVHNSTRRWRFLTSYYRALARLERAESESKRGLHVKSVSTLKKASELFRQSNISLQRDSVPLERSKEKLLVDSLAVESKDDYCLARIQLEGARINESRGDHYSASEEYGQVAEKFLEIAKTSPTVYERKEMLFLSSLSRGLQNIAQSTIFDQASSLREASRHFDESAAQASDESLKSFASGYKHLCLGIIASNQFIESLEQPCYDDASRHFDLARNNFSMSGFRGIMSQVQAHKLLIDAQAIINRNQVETDVQKRNLALETARAMIRQVAEVFGDENHGAGEVRFQSLARSLDLQADLSKRATELLEIASHKIATGFVFPGSLGQHVENWLGNARPLEAGVEVDYDARRTLEDHIAMKFQIANSGDHPIKLIRIDNLLPEKSKLSDIPEGSRLEGHSLVLKPKTLGKLEVETLTIGLRTRGKERPIVLQPTMVFHDDKGLERSNSFPLKIIGSSPILDFLTAEFFDDYNKKRLSIEHAGWRTMTNVVEATKVPRSQLYGEPRWGHSYGLQLGTLIRSGLVEERVFPHERGRGGRIAKIRLAYNNQSAKEYITGLGDTNKHSQTR